MIRSPEPVVRHVAGPVGFETRRIPASSLGQANRASVFRRDLRVVLDRVGQKEAEGREDARVPGHDDRGHPQVGGHVHGVHAAGAAEGEEGEVPRVDAALDRDDPDGLFHVGVGDVDDALGRLERRLADRAGRARRRPRGSAPGGCVIRPPRKKSGSRRPRKRLASVTVGQVALAVAGRARVGARRSAGRRAASRRGRRRRSSRRRRRRNGCR